jgi:hypothetical protein
MQQGRDKTQTLLNVPITTFIPPFNNFNGDTITALRDLDFTHMSSQIQIDTDAPYPLQGMSFYITISYILGQSLYRFPAGAATNDLSEVRYNGVPWQQTWQEIQSQLASDGFATVMLHPMEYSVTQNGTYVNELNTTQFDQLRQLLQVVKDSGLRIVTIGKINTNSNIKLTGSLTTNSASTGESTSSFQCNCVAFHLDGVQDYYLSPSQSAVMDVFANALVPLTLGVITGAIGQDATLMAQINYYKDNFPLEIGFNGDNNTQFTDYATIDDQVAEFAKGLP